MPFCVGGCGWAGVFAASIDTRAIGWNRRGWGPPWQALMLHFGEVTIGKCCAFGRPRHRRLGVKVCDVSLTFELIAAEMKTLTTDRAHRGVPCSDLIGFDLRTLFVCCVVWSPVLWIWAVDQFKDSVDCGFSNGLFGECVAVAITAPVAEELFAQHQESLPVTRDECVAVCVPY